mmetsp:Transcript_16882/g.50495  ORF Transcript_16882/g.50495 Transcript_16882/m.50495 type:complete len:540 (+) Transcript_16882:48-1667(+)
MSDHHHHQSHFSSVPHSKHAVAAALGGRRLRTVLSHLTPCVPTQLTDSEGIGSSTVSAESEVRAAPLAHSALSGPYDADIIIVGAGVVGSAMAFRMGQSGRRVLLLERDLGEPNRIVGELLQPGGVSILNKMGLGHCLEGIDAQRIFGYGVLRNDQPVQLPYPKDESGERPEGRAFHHGKFVMALRKAAMEHPLVTTVQATVSELIEHGSRIFGVVYKHNKEIKRAHAPLTVVCDGCFSKFRRGRITNQPEGTSSFVGLILKDVEIPFPNHGHVILAKPSPVLFYPIGSHDVRVLVDVPNPLPSNRNGALTQYLAEVTCPQLPASMQASFLRALEEDRPRSMPNNRLHSEPFTKEGMILLGDAFNMRHPLTGGGMTVGLSDASIVADIIDSVTDVRNTSAVHVAYSDFFEARKPLAATINVLAQALYEVFAASQDPALPDMQEACFEYFKLGGQAVDGPMSLLSGMAASPYLLVSHFFAVAVFGVLRTLTAMPSATQVPRAFRLLRAATAIIAPLLKDEHLLDARAYGSAKSLVRALHM